MKRAMALAIAVTLAAGTFFGAQIASTANEQESKSVYTPITPCRLMDTRPAPNRVNTFGPLGERGVHVVRVTGSQGKCNLPTSGVTGVAMNVTAVNGTATSYLTIWPSDAPDRPTASSLNWVAGQPPTPNKVDSAVSSTGNLRMFNFAGSVNVIVDIVGYYTAAGFGTATVVSADIVMELNQLADGTNGQAIANCPAGQIAIAGGVEGPVSIALNVRSNRPNPTKGLPTGWYGDMRSADNTDETVGAVAKVYAVCVSP